AVELELADDLGEGLADLEGPRLGALVGVHASGSAGGLDVVDLELGEGRSKVASPVGVRARARRERGRGALESRAELDRARVTLEALGAGEGGDRRGLRAKLRRAELEHAGVAHEVPDPQRRGEARAAGGRE